jgi:hypothetical protein
LLGDVVPRRRQRPWTLPLDELRSRNAASHESLITSHILCQFHRGEINLLDLHAIAGAAQLFARAEERERLQHLRPRVKKLAVKLLQRVGLLDSNFRRKLATATARPDLLASRAAVDVAAAF